MTAPPTPSQADLAYEAVRDLLVRLEIAPGAPIVESELMERTGFGRTPLREALNRLESERLVRIFSRRGTFAAGIDLADLALITDLREELEAHAAERAAERATTADREVLAGLAGEIGTGDPEAEMALDTEIHRAIYRAAHNHFLEETAGRYYNLSMRVWRLYMDRLPDIDAHIDEHRDLLDAIVAGEAERAGSLARAHVRSFETAVRALL
ncbi:MAG: GntR family transcriptional regulator [Acidimicrobiia bacterium]|nr:GntR family transcriptional regulator [Acidimicrobiia bacterium]